MFEFLKVNKNGDVIPWDIISVDLDRLQASRLAYERAIAMIAKAVARTEIIKQAENGEMVQDLDYFNLNVQPNPNETAYEFWYNVTSRLLKEQECLLIPLPSGLFIADSYGVNQNVLKPKVYENITIINSGDYYRLTKRFKADEVIHIRYDNEKVKSYLKGLLKQYDSLIDRVSAMYKVGNTPKFLAKLNAQGRLPGQAVEIRDKKTGKVIAETDYANKLVEDLKSDRLSVISLTDGRDISQLEINTGNTNTDALTKVISQAETIAANAFDIPINAFNGTITEKASSTADFITYAVLPVTAAIDNALNARMVGLDGYLAGERLSHWFGSFEHKDLTDAAAGLDKLRGIGFNFDEIRKSVGWPQIGDEFSTSRALTKNYGNGNTEEI